MRLEAGVSVSLRSCRRGDAVAVVSAKPEGASRPMRAFADLHGKRRGRALHGDCDQQGGKEAARRPF
jgi:hypothetical protein